MAQFLKNPQLNSALDEIFESARKELIIISPFIKLHSNIKDALKKHINNDGLEITVVFGKNEDQIFKSLSLDEFEFFSQFPNISIRYEPRLHAKYYANESMAILSSMNLYDYSQNNNIEFGILTETTLLNSMNIGNSLDKDAFNYFESVIKNSIVKFSRKPVYKINRFKKKHLHSETEIDLLSEELKKPLQNRKSKKEVVPKNKVILGYCIRTGIKIPFNPKNPLSDKAFGSWNKYKDENYPEKFCHFSGEDSKGETTFAKPILRKNWKKSQNL